MEERNLIDISHDITIELQHEASIKLSEARAYYDGYVKACEDFGRRIREEAYNL